MDAAIAAINSFAWVVFSSANGVRSFFGRFESTGRDLRALAVQLAAIGPATAEALAEYHLKPICSQSEYRAESLAQSLIESLKPAPADAHLAGASQPRTRGAG